MLKRAYISAVIAVIAAIFGFSGLLDGAASIAKGISYAFAGFCAVSLLFSLFEDASESPTVAQPTEVVAPQLVFNFSTEEPALAPVHV
jgi:uncharacterized membrane protein YtjA (UPF0391 family)